ncbi:hypothetical protein AAU57_09520 [Nonlabens sp. YIK11]|uniref:hypothetical protein n=1 Tax=Nonlabens sp. YIK11 TaxID=1453349 RepID=UPI0006DCF1C9|nr:hypothetical protein [Nonlabens sp. YIK11]KQC33528.1 hypothetical protein AAU57_09520 [Nonlabens sp. YIK11]
MGSIKKFIRKSWHDTVGSKVIAFLIISILTGIGFIVSSLFQLLFGELSLSKVVASTKYFLTSEVVFPLWLIFIFLIILLSIYAKKIFNYLIQIRKRKNFPSDINEPEKICITETSTSFFHRRMSEAFPDVRGLGWFNNPKIAIQRLEVLLKDPLVFDNWESEFHTDPSWWFRANHNMKIDFATKIDRSTFLLNHDRLKN